MKKFYAVQWTEIVTYQTEIEANSPEEAKELFMSGEFDDIQEYDRCMNADDVIYVDGEVV